MKTLAQTLTLAALAAALHVPSQAIAAPAAEAPSPCAEALAYLQSQYDNDRTTHLALDAINAGLQDLPYGYRYGGSSANPWRTKTSDELLGKLIDMFHAWCVALPAIEGDQDNALDPILYFSWLYFRNPAGVNFVQGRDPEGQPLATGPEFLDRWNKAYRVYMDSPASTADVPHWAADPRIEIDDYQITNAANYGSWNEFFARNLKSDAEGSYPSRPVTMPERDYVIVSPTDCIMNPLVQIVKTDVGEYHREYVDNPLQRDTVLDIKNIPISVEDMLGNAPEHLKEKFVGGSGLACVLMPNTYHHFHAPVDGKVLHAEVISEITTKTPGTYGYSDFPNWVQAQGNVGGPGTDFSQFQAFQRGVIIIEVTYQALPGGPNKAKTRKGYVASIPVGLDSVNSVVLNTCTNPPRKPDGKPATDGVNCFDVQGDVIKGKTKLGNFFFGGSLDILLFSPGMVSPAVQTRMGTQIGVINTGESPKSPWSLDKPQTHMH